MSTHSKLKYGFFLLFFVLFCELASRAILGDRLPLIKDRGMNFFGVGDLLPNRDFIESYKRELPFWVKTDGLGRRSLKEWPLKKQEGKIRIAALGDSFTFGVHVNTQEAWPARLEKTLNEAYGLDAEVMNLGNTGYTISDEYYLLKEKVLGTEPDLILIAFYSNDVADFHPVLRSFTQRGSLEHSALRKKIHQFKTFLKESATVSLLLSLKYKYASWRFQKTKLPYTPPEREGVRGEAYMDDAQLEKGMGEYLSYLEKVIALAQTAKRPLAFLFIPHYSEIASDQERHMRHKIRIQEKLHQARIPYLDLLPALREKGDAESLYLLPEEWHMSRYGYLIVARKAAHFIHLTFGNQFKDA